MRNGIELKLYMSACGHYTIGAGGAGSRMRNGIELKLVMSACGHYTVDVLPVCCKVFFHPAHVTGHLTDHLIITKTFFQLNDIEIVVLHVYGQQIDTTNAGDDVLSAIPIIKAEIDEAISQSMTESQFIANLKKRGYEVKLGKDISVRPPGKERFFRLQRNFGESYSRDGIIRQMRGRRPTFPEPPPKRRIVTAKCKGRFKTTKKLTGFRALYFHYLYLMGRLPKKRQKPPTRVHFLFREDLVHIDRISNEISLLYRHRIDTTEQLFSYKQGLTERMEALTAERTRLRKELRRARDEPLQTELKAKIALLSKGLGDARREVGLCDDIALRSAGMREKMRAVHWERGGKSKETSRTEVQFRRNLER